MWGAVPQNVAKGLLVGKAQDVVEILQGIFRVATGMRSPKRGDSSLRAEQVTQGIGSMSRLSERADEDQIYLRRQFRQQIFKPRIADERDFMPLISAPYADYLGHDAGKIRIHHPSIQTPSGSSRNDIYDPDMEFSHVENAPSLPREMLIQV